MSSRKKSAVNTPSGSTSSGLRSATAAVMPNAPSLNWNGSVQITPDAEAACRYQDRSRGSYPPGSSRRSGTRRPSAVISTSEGRPPSTLGAERFKMMAPPARRQAPINRPSD